MIEVIPGGATHHFTTAAAGLRLRGVIRFETKQGAVIGKMHVAVDHTHGALMRGSDLSGVVSDTGMQGADIGSRGVEAGGGERTRDGSEGHTRCQSLSGESELQIEVVTSMDHQFAAEWLGISQLGGEESAAGNRHVLRL